MAADKNKANEPPDEILALLVVSLCLILPLRTRLLWTFSLLMLMSLARLEDPEATLPLEMEWPRTDKTSMWPLLVLLYTSETYSMNEVRWLPRGVLRGAPLDTSKKVSRMGSGTFRVKLGLKASSRMLPLCMCSALDPIL